MISTFKELELKTVLLKASYKVGYETPTPIQAQTIPFLLQNKDVLGQTQIGTGITAAFTLPLLSNFNLRQNDPQPFVLTSTRELAIQVAETSNKNASQMKNCHVLPIYGGHEYGGKIRALKKRNK